MKTCLWEQLQRRRAQLRFALIPQVLHQDLYLKNVTHWRSKMSTADVTCGSGFFLLLKTRVAEWKKKGLENDRRSNQEPRKGKQFNNSIRNASKMEDSTTHCAFCLLCNKVGPALAIISALSSHPRASRKFLKKKSSTFGMGITYPTRSKIVYLSRDVLQWNSGTHCSQYRVAYFGDGFVIIYMKIAWRLFRKRLPVVSYATICQS